MHYPIISPDSHGFLSIVPIAGLVSTTAFMALAPDQSCKALDCQGGFQEFGAPKGEFMANICLYGNFQGEFMAHLWQIYEIWKKCDFPKKSDWWFHRCFIFPYLGNVIIPTDELIFFRGVETTNQMANIWNVCSKIWSNPPEEHGVFVGNASMKTGHECSTIFVYRRVYVFLLFLSKKFQGFKQHNIEMSLAKHWD
jgi:hypothetical protein